MRGRRHGGTGALSCGRTGRSCVAIALVVVALASACDDPTRDGRPLEIATCDSAFVPAAEEFSDIVRDVGVAWAGLQLRWRGRVVCECFVGEFDRDGAMVTVSAAKWLSAATVLALVDEGLLSLDDSAASFIPAFTGEAAGITLRQLLSHTSGIQDYHACMYNDSITLGECADRIAERPLWGAPGSGFRYGGAAFTVAGRMAEVAAGQDWATVFGTRMAGPLGLTRTTYGDTRNPMLSEGYVAASLQDYGRFLQMVLDTGRAGDRRILSAATIAEMRRDQRRGAPWVSPSTVYAEGYGLGVWLSGIGADGLAGRLTSPGAAAYTPWVDFDRRLAGVFMTFDFWERLGSRIGDLQQLVRDIVDAQSGAAAFPRGIRAPHRPY